MTRYLVLPVLVVLVGCSRDGLPVRSTTTTTSATMPRPESTVPSTRTIDNAGFVDNGGRTSDMTSRTQFSGMRATESGSERPTGTPGSGLPLPFTQPARGNVGEGAGAAQSVRGPNAPSPSGGPVSELVPRVAEARCDREASCNRVGAKKSYASKDVCMTTFRESTQTELAEKKCPRGVDQTQLASCLNALRNQACSTATTELDSVPACRLSALCAP